MAQKAGSADLPLHGGQVPKWLADRMTRLGAVMSLNQNSFPSIKNARVGGNAEPNTPSAGEVLVRNEYAPAAYCDLLLANRVYLLNPKLPSVIGGEGAGIVEAIRPGVTSVKVGAGTCLAGKAVAI